uniref:Pyrin domain-containing protein n=1 Tax=Monopterus albus TaxID=43700 RepID=A0A3Q3IZT6_MONAL
MSHKTIKMALVESLEDLTERDLEKFRHQLLDRREEPRVRRRAVEGKSLLDLTDVLVSTFTEEGALPVVVQILQQIGCNEEAQKLGEITVGHWLQAAEGFRGSTGLDNVHTLLAISGLSDDEHFSLSRWFATI